MSCRKRHRDDYDSVAPVPNDTVRGPATPLEYLHYGVRMTASSAKRIQQPRDDERAYMIPRPNALLKRHQETVPRRSRALKDSKHCHQLPATRMPPNTTATPAEEVALRECTTTMLPHLQVTQILVPNFFQKQPIFGIKNPLWGKVKHNSTTIKHHEDVLRYGARYTVEEIVEQVRVAHPDIDNKRVSTRLSDAKDMVSKEWGVARVSVKRGFDEAQTYFGVTKRKNHLAAIRRKAAKKEDAAIRAIDVTAADENDGVSLSRDEEGDVAAILVGLSCCAWARGVGVQELEERTVRGPTE